MSQCCPPAPLLLRVHRQLLRPLRRLPFVRSLPLTGAGAKVDVGVDVPAAAVDTEQLQPSAWPRSVSHAEGHDCNNCA